MKVGDHYLHIKDKRKAVVVGCNERVVEYQFTSFAEPQGAGKRARRLNVMTMDRDLFLQKFEAAQ
jgi:hypothetical protein